MYDEERFILKSHYAPSPLDLIAIGKTHGWNTQIYKNAARDFTLERNADVVGRGLQLAPNTVDTDLYIGTPEWHDFVEEDPSPEESG